MGLISTLIIFYLVWVQINGIRFSNKNEALDYNNIISKSLSIFGLVLLIGVLIKEPSYSRSYVFLAVFFLATNWFGVIRLKNYRNESACD